MPSRENRPAFLHAENALYSQAPSQIAAANGIAFYQLYEKTAFSCQESSTTEQNKARTLSCKDLPHSELDVVPKNTIVRVVRLTR